nr:5'-nucleotidase [Myxococcus xanthus]
MENGVSLSREDSRPGRFPQVSGLEFTFDSDRPAGQRVLGVTVGGRPLDKAATYRLATLSFLASGKDGYDMLRNQPSTPARVTGNSPLDVLAEAFRTGRPSPHAQADGRISRLGTGALAPDARQPPAPLK